jgi:hypothetical protein
MQLVGHEKALQTGKPGGPNHTMGSFRARDAFYI